MALDFKMVQDAILAEPPEHQQAVALGYALATISHVREAAKRAWLDAGCTHATLSRALMAISDDLQAVAAGIGNARQVAHNVPGAQIPDPAAECARVEGVPA